MPFVMDEVVDMARTAIDVTGNALASVVIACWEGASGWRRQRPRWGTSARPGSGAIGDSKVAGA
jgi:Na+/H+-dicarboxylate symporter